MSYSSILFQMVTIFGLTVAISFGVAALMKLMYAIMQALNKRSAPPQP
ncbi:MAG: hypothetical protein WC789_11735 [Lentisphaeria bacterium]|jgi:hypothetical protein